MKTWKIYHKYEAKEAAILELEDNLTIHELVNKLAALGHIDTNNIMGDVHFWNTDKLTGTCICDSSGYCHVRLLQINDVYVSEPTLAQVATQVQAHKKDLPKCPTCGSTNLTKKGAGARMIDGWFFGRHSVEGRAQFLCDNCGYQW